MTIYQVLSLIVFLLSFSIVAFSAFRTTRSPWLISAVGLFFALTLPWICWLIALALYIKDGYQKGAKAESNS